MSDNSDQDLKEKLLLTSTNQGFGTNRHDDGANADFFQLKRASERSNPANFNNNDEEIKFELQDLTASRQKNSSLIKQGGSDPNQTTGNNPLERMMTIGSQHNPTRKSSNLRQPFGVRAGGSEHSAHHSVEKKKNKNKLGCWIILYNMLENFLLFMLLLNSVIFPNLGSAIYLAYCFLLTATSMSKEERRVKMKFILSVLIVVISFCSFIGKSGYLIYLNNQGPLTLDKDEKQFLNLIGFYIQIDTTTTKIKFINTFMTIFFDFIEVILSILITITYSSQKKDVLLVYTQDDKTQYLLHPNFEKHQDKICTVALIFVLIILLNAWANNQYERYHLKSHILTFSQYLLILQLILTFICQLGFIKEEISQSNFAFVFDMFGLILHNLPTYSVILHLLSITLCIQALQVYNTTRLSSFKNIGFIPATDNDEDIDRKSDNARGSGMRTLKRRLDRGHTVGSGGTISKPGKSSVVDKFREKTIGLKMKQDESSINIVAQKYYKDFSPQIWLWICRFTAFIGCYAYHDFQSWIILMWIMHSTIFLSTKRFVNQTINYYLPTFVVFFLFYYMINIPRVIEFQKMKDHYDTWTSFGFYQFSVPCLEISLMILGILPFFFLAKSKQYLDFNKDDQKKKFLEKLTSKDSPSIYYIIFSFITSLDLIVFITIFFSGVNKIDFYHVFLMFFFVAYIVAPIKFKENYIFLLYYVDFFVFEKYLYTLFEHYLDQGGVFVEIWGVFGLSTEYPPKFQQWLLIFVVFLQFQVYRLLSDEKQVSMHKENASNNFKARYPRINNMWELLQHLKKECLILITFVVFFMMVVFSDKSIINWGFQIIICIFIITYIGVGNEAPHDTGIKRLQKIWPVITYYASIILILQITYQFAALPFIRKSLRLDYLLDLLPTWVRKNIGVIGFQVFSKYIWQKFLIYLMYFAIGVYVRKQMEKWSALQQESLVDNQVHNDKNVSRNSDMLEDYFLDKRNLNWKQEYLKIRFTTPYLVYKLKKLWIIIDKLSQILFVFISLMIMILSNYWQISLSMAVHLTCFISLILVISSKLYQNRKIEKKTLRNIEKGGKYVRQLTVEECGKHWTKYKKVVNGHQVKIRQRVWFFQFVITLLCIVSIYPTEFIYQIRQTFLDEKSTEIVNIFDYLIFYLFWGGVYHSPYQVSNHSYLYNVYGYLVILVLLIFEKNAQKWALDRFGCTQELMAKYQEIEYHLDRGDKIDQPEKKISIADQIIHEGQEFEEQSYKSSQIEVEQSKSIKNEDSQNKQSKLHISMKSDKDSVSQRSMINNEKDYLPDNEDEIREEIKKWIMKKYKLRLLNGVKILLEDTIQLLMLISSVYKDSVIGLVLLFGVFLYLTRRKIKTMARLAWIVGVCMIIQYGLALSNLTSENNPMDFPAPFQKYPSLDDPEGNFFIPWYKKIPFLSQNFQWAMYLAMGISNTKLNSLWIDYVIMGCIQAHLFYFGCQLFSIDLKVQKGEYLIDLLQKYCVFTVGQSNEETIKKESKKLKRTVFLYNFYKSFQMTIFMHFHQMTIVITLLLAILARSLFSFGYIIVCMIMIYENHKFFKVDQSKNFNLQKVLKYWLRPYVFLDLTLQLFYQIPLEVMHQGQDSKWSWQNIIGFQDIWVKDPNNVDEVVARSIVFMILKAFTYYFVTLQIQIFDSTAYKVYIKKDFQRYIDMADTKAITARKEKNG